MTIELRDADVATYSNKHGYKPAGADRWNSRLLATFVGRDPPPDHRE